jgi:hypothetical protein
MQVTIILDNGGGSDVPLASTDELILDFRVAGYFCTSQADDFCPPLPNGHHPIGRSGHKPLQANHDTKYCFDPNTPCPCGHRGMHTIHTGA